MTTYLSVRSSAGAYPVILGAQVLDRLGDHLESLTVQHDTRLFIVTDETVASLGYAERLVNACQARGYQATVAVVPPRDESKSLAMAESLYGKMLDAGLRRDGIVLALGGGVVGDLAGFVAATYLRGIRFIQMPTTLLAHDSSIGGKVGINLPRGKNLVGAFHQPMAVLYDVGTLESLPPREWQNGMAEVIKHTIIGNPSLFERLETNPVPLYPGNDAVEPWLAEAIQVKIDVVEQDEFEQETRMWLNLGHTVGHAVEQVSHYGLGHGEAIAIGMRVEAELAAARGWLSASDRQRIITVLDQHGLPIRPPEFPFDEVVAALQVDKKHTNSGWTFVLPKSIGQVVVARDVLHHELAQAWGVSLRERNV